MRGKKASAPARGRPQQKTKSSTTKQLPQRKRKANPTTRPMGRVGSGSVPTRSVDEWAGIIKRDLGDAIDSIIRAGTHLTQAKHQLGKGHYGDMLKSIGLHERTAQRLIAIAENKVLINPEYHSRLPVSMRTLAELAQIPAPVLEGYIKDGTVNIDMERIQVETLRNREAVSLLSDVRSATDRATIEVEPDDEPPSIAKVAISLPHSQPRTPVPQITNKEVYQAGLQGGADRLIDLLAQTRPDVCAKAVELVLGERKADFERFAGAVRELSLGLDRGRNARRSSMLRVIDSEESGEVRS
jgi:hypothetical protein